MASRYLLSGIACCGNCGKALTGQEAKEGKFFYYVCGTFIKKGSGPCSASYLNAEKLENLVIEKVEGHILIEKNLKELVQMFNKKIDVSIVFTRLWRGEY